MRLIADRFVVDGDHDIGYAGCALDLATGRPVRLTMAPAGDVGAWLVACDDASRERRVPGAMLVDYGRTGTRDRFEAWSADASPSVAAAVAAAPLTVTIIERPELAALAEMCERPDDRRPRLVALWGPPGSGRGTVVDALARIARRNGIVPVLAPLVPAHAALIENRTLLVIDSDAPRATGAWLHALLRSPRPHLCVVVSDEEVAGMEGIGLARASAQQLMAAVRITTASPELSRRVARAADRAHGLPGRFTRALCGAPLIEVASRRAPAAARVAEQPAAYGSASGADSMRAGGVDCASDAADESWPAAGELASLRRRLAAADALVHAGRYAPAVRGLRQAVGALARRGAWTDAARGATSLGAALLSRGRPSDALRALDDARGHAARGDDSAMFLDVAVLSGHAWIDLAKIDEGERVLSGAMAAARALGDRGRVARAATALSRCLFWRGSYAEALRLVDTEGPDRDPALQILRLRAFARASVAQGESTLAMAAIDEARALAEGRGPAVIADVAYTSACVRLAVGDLAGVDRDVRFCLASARGARLPMRALRARLLQVTVDRRRDSGKGATAVAALRRLAAAAPPLVRARYELEKAMIDLPGGATASRHAARTGLKALALFGGAVPDRIAFAASDPFVEDVVAILRACQHADDETSVLREVCERVRRQLHAAAAAFIHPGDRRFDVLVCDGSRIDTEVGERACQSGLTIAPHQIRERLEAAAAVQYGGRVVGALCARWTIGHSHDLSRAAAVLSMAATAAAPLLAAVLAHRSRPAPPAALDLLGVTPPMAELRNAVERAAGAPFAVLIEGESGSGKELVARALHRCGPRRDRTFCTLNCAALPDELVEAELFGHSRGAFSGAVADRAGVFEEAHGGTLFLDEIGELSLRAQAKLLRVMQEGELRRIGENVSRRVDARIVCATNRSLRHEAAAGRFRPDLLYRLDVVRIAVPPLRDRREDVPLLADYFWIDATRRIASRATLAESTRAALSVYDWPGNVRELQNVLAALAVRSPKRGVVPPTALPMHFSRSARPQIFRLDLARRTFEEDFVRSALVRAGGRRSRVAAELGVTRQGLTKLLSRLGIQ